MQRKLKPIHLRKPKETVNHDELVKTVARNTGFTIADVRSCIDEYLSVMKFEILERKSVKLSGIGSLQPMVQPPRKVTNMGGTGVEDYNRIIMDARWNIKFQAEISLIKDVRDIMVTKKDLEKIYYK